jgi:hypothetical protein
MWPRLSVVAVGFFHVLPCVGNGSATALKVVVNTFGPDLKKICKRIASARSLFDLIVLGNGREVR